MIRTFPRLSLLILLILPVNYGWSQQSVEAVVERNVAMKTRDGVTLRADIYRPVGDTKVLVLLQRTPYNKDGGDNFARRAVARGFMVVIQDVRGRYASEG